jgi:hypothetical protein
MKVKVPLKTDADGFLTQECPHCNQVFKAEFADSGQHLRHCPYCGTQGQHCWYTVPQIKYMESVAAGTPGKKPREGKANMPIHKFACHGARIKYDGAAENLYCIVCGEQTPVTRKAVARKATPRKKPPRKARS